jgi:transcription termination factor Rho
MDGHVTIAELESKTREDLLDLAKDLGVSGYSALKKQDLVVKVLKAQT